MSTSTLRVRRAWLWKSHGGGQRPPGSFLEDNGPGCSGLLLWKVLFVSLPTWIPTGDCWVQLVPCGKVFKNDRLNDFKNPSRFKMRKRAAVSAKTVWATRCASPQFCVKSSPPGDKMYCSGDTADLWPSASLQESDMQNPPQLSNLKGEGEESGRDNTNIVTVHS